MSTEYPVQEIAAEDLHFDYENPRLVELGVDKGTTEEQMVQLLWETMDVREIVMSIASGGFFRFDPLIVDSTDGRNVVIEGNRRLAAVRVVRDREKFLKLLGQSIPGISVEHKASTDTLPTIRMSRGEAWHFLGFKHVNGPAKWGSFAKAKYIADIHNSHGIPLDEIATQIGDTHQTVQRLYRGLMVLNQAEQMKVFDRTDAYRRSLPFSHLYVGLDRSGIEEFLQLKPESSEDPQPVPENRKEHLGELMLWLFGSRSNDQKPVVQSQNPNLKQLDEVLQHSEAIAALRSGTPLEQAVEMTVPPGLALEQELLQAKRSLVRARGLVTEGYDGSKSLHEMAVSVWRLAADLADDMERQRNTTPRRPPE